MKDKKRRDMSINLWNHRVIRKIKEKECRNEREKEKIIPDERRLINRIAIRNCNFMRARFLLLEFLKVKK